MKKHFLLIIFSLTFLSGFSQDYTLTVHEENYEHLSNDTVIISDSINEGSQWHRLPMFFNPNFIKSKGDPNFEVFQIFTPYHELGYNGDCDGELNLTPFGLGANVEFRHNPNDPTSNISYHTDGNAGTRIFKVQYRNMVFEGYSPADKINFQFWWHETTGIFEFRYGELSISDRNKAFKGANTPYVSIGVDTNDSDGEPGIWRYYHGDVMNPEIEEKRVLVHRLDTLPHQGLVYRFTPTFLTGVDNNNPFKGFNLYPNPSENGKVFLDHLPVDEKITATVYGIKGERILTKVLNPMVEQNQINIETPGVYLLQLKSKSGYSATRKIWVK
ncbi:MAG: hypothetical protein ACJATA_001278 [Sphingobacteriales bacterium]|jgi:hypothetical protein